MSTRALAPKADVARHVVPPRRLREIKAAETRKYQREEARNMLEAFIYRVRDLLENVDFGAASLEHERKLIQEKAEAANEWLWDEAEKATTKELKAKRTEIECVKRPRERYARVLPRTPALLLTSWRVFKPPSGNSSRLSRLARQKPFHDRR